MKDHRTRAWNINVGGDWYFVNKNLVFCKQKQLSSKRGRLSIFCGDIFLDIAVISVEEIKPDIFEKAKKEIRNELKTGLEK